MPNRIAISLLCASVLGTALFLLMAAIDPTQGSERSEKEDKAAKALMAKGARINMTTDPMTAPVWAVILDDPMIDDDAISLLKELPNLRQVMVGECSSNVTGKTLTAIGDHPELEAVVTHVSTDEMLRSLGLCKKLGTLVIRDRDFTDTSAAFLPSMKGLFYVSLKETSLTDDGYAHVGRVLTLRQLILEGEKIGDAGVQHLRALRQLRELDLSNTKVTDEGLTALSNMPRLYRLTLTGLPITEKGLAHLKHCTGLRHLHVSGDGITDAALDALEECDLDFLWLENTKVSKPRQLKFLQDKPGLKIYP